ncbi:hypothetical protein NECAME_12382 [Necator americanus]|uniref:Uncharacterized protein n=1 Tax=Necator americanus TaxID=51031 RepID=W2T2J5_NECAM|nr:hypothetical protein NECAME_12382 [Necator americanus]ETN75456.1 hypothetical protein NECAME_12382 [Necator americanus]
MGLVLTQPDDEALKLIRKIRKPGDLDHWPKCHGSNLKLGFAGRGEEELSDTDKISTMTSSR